MALDYTAMCAAIRPRTYTDAELERAAPIDLNPLAYDDEDLAAGQLDMVRAEGLLQACTADELARMLRAGAVPTCRRGLGRSFGYEPEQIFPYDDEIDYDCLLTHVMHDVDKMRVVLEASPGVDGRGDAIAYLRHGGGKVSGLLLLLAHCDHCCLDETVHTVAHAEGLYHHEPHAWALVECCRRRDHGLFAGREVVGTALRACVPPPAVLPPLPSYGIDDGDTFEDALLDVSTPPLRLSAVDTLLAEILPGREARSIPEVIAHVRDAGRIPELVDCVIADPKDTWMFRHHLEDDIELLFPENHSVWHAPPPPLAAHGFAIPKKKPPCRRPHPFDHDSPFAMWRLCCFGPEVRVALGLDDGHVDDDTYGRLLERANAEDEQYTVDALIEAVHFHERPLLHLAGVMCRITGSHVDCRHGDDDLEDEDKYTHKLARIADPETSFSALTSANRYVVETAIDAYLNARRYASIATLLVRASGVITQALSHLCTVHYYTSRNESLLHVLMALARRDGGWRTLARLVRMLKTIDHRLDRDRSARRDASQCWQYLRKTYFAGRAQAALIYAMPALAAVREAHWLRELLLRWQEAVALFAPDRAGGKRLRREYDEEEWVGQISHIRA